MGNVNLPMPVALAGGAICILGGYVLGVVAGPDTTSRTTAIVESYDAGTGRLCLGGDGIKGQEGTVVDGQLCGTWRRASGVGTPHKGDQFRFVSLAGGSGDSSAEHPGPVLIYGDVVP
jgi:hypothetical protein